MKKLLAIVGLLLTLTLCFVSCGEVVSVTGVSLNEAGEIIVAMSDGTTQNLGKITAGTSPDNNATNTTSDDNPQGLSFFPLPDGTYAVSLGTAVYLEKISIPATHNGKAVTKLVAAVEGMIDNCPLKEISIPHTITEIGPRAFAAYYRNLETVIFADNSQLKSIGEGAFENCKKLKSISIPATVTELGSDAFGGCDFLETVTFEANSQLQSIGANAFHSCGKLQNIPIPETVTEIGPNAFSDCNSLATTTYDNATYFGSTANPYFVLMKATSTDITACTIHPNTTFISPEAFKNCSSLISIEIPAKVTSIGEGAFENCSNLASFTFSKNSSLSSLPNVFGNWAPKTIDTLDLPDSTTEIAFANLANKCQNIILPVSVTRITNGGAGGNVTVYYEGTKAQWNNINYSYLFENHTILLYHYSESQPTTDGNYWHYVNGTPTIWN